MDGGRVDRATDYSLLVDLVRGSCQIYGEGEEIPDTTGKYTCLICSIGTISYPG